MHEARIIKDNTSSREMNRRQASPGSNEFTLVDG